MIGGCKGGEGDGGVEGWGDEEEWKEEGGRGLHILLFWQAGEEMNLHTVFGI